MIQQHPTPLYLIIVPPLLAYYIPLQHKFIIFEEILFDEMF